MKSSRSFAQFIQAQPLMQVADFATFDGTYPRVRPMILICHDGFFWLATGTADDKFGQITSHPQFECLIHTKTDKGRGYTRFRGTADVVQDVSCKTALMQVAPFITNYFSSADDPAFVLIQLHPLEGESMPPGEDYVWGFDMHC
jgi:uncharacterized pyridoxamine 5'-phosphate oxidase family protein